MRKFLRELFGLFLLFWALLLLLSLVSFNSDDPSFNLVKSGAVEIQNKAGLFGAYAAGFLNDIFGIGALLWPFVFAALGGAYISAAYSLHWWRWCGLFLLTICLLMAASSLDISIGDLSGGGMVGNSLHYNGRRFLSPVGSFLIWFFIFLAGMQLTCNFSWLNLASRLACWARRKIACFRPVSGPGGEGEKLCALACFMQKSRFFIQKLSMLPRRLQAIGAPRPEAAAKLPEIALEPLNDSVKPEPGEERQSPQPGPASQLEEDEDDPFAMSEILKAETSLAEVPARTGVPPAPQSAPAPLAAPKTALREASGAAPVFAEPKDGENARRAGGEGLSFAIRAPRAAAATPGRAPLPSIELLKAQLQNEKTSPEDLQGKGKALMSCFKDFDIQGDLVRITPGPVVTMFEMRPAPGIRVSKIANLSDDLSLALKAVAVRIQAPIPGSDTVGIEIPNERRETVNFRELVASGEFQNGCGPLTMVLGKDIAGRPYMADLTRMPHLLVAGATGAGKSVCLNSILISLLYRSQPEDMRLLLVDPKRIEMAAYADLPHLVHPVVTEMSDAKNALDWAVHEMDNRYKAVARLGVRNVAAYNRKLAAFKDELPPDFADLEPLPYLVIVIDELADLMMTAAREVETSIVRLAQLARAAGIHMILATQRPSVDVVTGLIKANFPCRISFQVTSKHDSRTILDQVGAEHLLGRGDMLFKPSGGRLQRLHGPFLSDEEVQAVVNHWKSHLTPSYKVDFSRWTGESGASPAIGGDATSDPLYADARAFVLEQGRASISLLQRHLKIGFNRAARLMEQFERDGIIGPADGSKPRNVIR